MIDLYQAVNNMFSNPYYWAGKEHGYYSLFAEFLKVCLLVKMPQNTFTFWIVSAQLHRRILLHLQARKTARWRKRRRATMRYHCLAPVLSWGLSTNLVVRFYSLFHSLLVIDGCTNEPLDADVQHAM